jgi:WhiB family redox-sensing transcriptional regulator
LNEEWRLLAACRGADTELFFPDGTSIPREGTRAEPARQYCRHCPVTRACFEYAVQTNSRGIWGNTTSRQRAAILRRQAC